MRVKRRHGALYLSIRTHTIDMTKRIVRRRSPIHGNGVFAACDLPARTEIIEYRGRRMTHAQANRAYGNDARWINHSCAPNCQAWVIEHASGDPRKDRVVIETRRRIRKGEELTYDYGITLEERQTAKLKRIWACRCGAKKCTGTLLKPKQ